MKRKMMGAVSVAMAAAALSMPASASAQVVDDASVCSGSVETCTREVFRVVGQTLGDLADAVRDAGTTVGNTISGLGDAIDGVCIVVSDQCTLIGG